MKVCADELWNMNQPTISMRTVTCTVYKFEYSILLAGKESACASHVLNLLDKIESGISKLLIILGWPQGDSVGPTTVHRKSTVQFLTV
jgi:hypothetical protein